MALQIFRPVMAWHGLWRRGVCSTFFAPTWEFIGGDECCLFTNFQDPITSMLEIMARKRKISPLEIVAKFTKSPVTFAVQSLSTYVFTEMERGNSGLHNEPYCGKIRPCNFFCQTFAQLKNARGGAVAPWRGIQKFFYMKYVSVPSISEPSFSWKY